MGREQELRDAAKDGNVPKLESLLAAKKGSIMSSLRKALDINCQDDNGNTALHLAALNGQREAASLLLTNDASANIPETKGNYPLHLAAFNGHHEVADILLNQGPSRADVLQQNSGEDTPLHLAAQYGHTQVVQTLLQCHADPHMRNKKGETPLDLAAMYGRLPTVQVLILSDKSLVREQTEAISPLHVAARNGHTAVIEALLDFGMSVNVMCNPGSSLHEAALFGKVEAVKLLLKRGIDVNATNDAGDTVVDLLEDLPSERSQEITALIYEQSQLMMNSVQQRSKSMSITSQSSNEHNSQFAGARAASVSQKRTDSPYSVVQVPRISRIEPSFAQASISPLPPDAAGQEEVFNDSFLREMKAASPTVPEVPERMSTLESRKPVVRNVYEMTEPPDGENTSEDALYDVPPPRPKGDSVLSQDSDPSFPPPSTDEAIKTMRKYAEAQERLQETPSKSQNRETAQGTRGTSQKGSNRNEQKNISDFAKLHVKMSPPPQNNDVYHNVNISNRPLQNSNPSEDLISWDVGKPAPEQRPTSQFSPVKQKRTGTSVKDKSRDGSRPASTLNESYEWSKIDKIFSSFEDLIQCDINLDDDIETQQPDSIADWLTILGLSYYEASFLANGYDDIAFIGGDMLDEDDLREIGIQNSEHVRKILVSASKLPNPPQIGDPDFPIPEAVSEWLKRISLQDYETRFKMNGYENMDRVRAIWEFELTTSQRFADAEAPKSKQQSSGDDAVDLANQLLRAAEDMAQDFGNRKGKQETKDAPPPQSPTPKSPTSPRILKYQPSFNWIHKPEDLLYSTVMYDTQYLGSHPVMVVRGTQSTVDACKKMKSTSKMLQKIPTIKLSMSVRGIDFIDAQSQSTISSYDIRYISYCAQDPDDLSIFAYITKDAKTGKHYCHVFKGYTAALSDEIVLTIGQAFELAYHQHRVLIEQAKTSKQGEDDKNFHEAKNDLSSAATKEERIPPPKPKPYSGRMLTEPSGQR
eukprot:gene11628-21870_t